MGMYNLKREAMCEDGKVCVIKTDHYVIDITSIISKRGNSCIVYEGTIVEKDGKELSHPRLIILKEFFPVSKNGEFGFTRDKESNALNFEGTRDCEEYLEHLTQFHTGYTRQNEFSDDSNIKLMYTTVAPSDRFEFGDSVYVITDINIAKPLCRCVFLTLEDRVNVIYKMAILFRKLNNAGWMMTGIKPEDFLWIDNEFEKSVRVINFDGIVNVNCQDKLEKFTIDDMCNIATYMKELLFGDIVAEELISDKKKGLSVLENQYGESLCYSSKVGNEIIDILNKALQESYDKMDSFIDALNELKNKMKSAEANKKKKAVKKNKLHIAYSILDKYPVFDYYDYNHEEINNVLEVAIIGNGDMREDLLKAVISCVQMVNSQLNIRIISNDVVCFWEQNVISKNPELKNTINCYLNDVVLDEYKVDDKTVCRPLANVYLCEDETKFTDVLSKTNYLFVTCTDVEKSIDFITDIISVKSNKIFLGTFYEKKEDKVKIVGSIGKVHAFALREKIEEKIGIESLIDRKGLLVHSYYERGNDPRISVEQIEKNYYDDLYNVESSERCALHFRYKLMSIGIDLNKMSNKDAAISFYKMVLSSKEGEEKRRFDELVVLEHISWEAHMILSGYKKVEDIEQLELFAFEGEKNTWVNKIVKLHPYIRSSRPGRGLYRKSWRTDFRGKKIEKLDELDKWSIYVDQVCNKKVKERQTEINELFGSFIDMLKEMKNKDNTLEQLMYELELEKQKCLSHVTLSNVTWKEAYVKVENHIMNHMVSDEYRYRILLEKLKDIKEKMHIAVEISGYRDVKCSDEDIIRALPRFLLWEEENVTIIKPIGNNIYENVYASLLVEPRRLILISKSNGEDKRRECERFLRLRGLNTEVKLCEIENISKYNTVGMRWVDCTNCDDYGLVDKLRNNFKASVFKIDNRKIKSVWGDDISIELYNRPLVMTVDEIFNMKNAVVSQEFQSSEQIYDNQYLTLWHLYRELDSGEKWGIFIKALNEIGKKNRSIIDTETKGKSTIYELPLIENDILRETRIDIVLERLKEEGIIEKLVYKSLYDKTVVKITTKYEDVYLNVLHMIELTSERGHSFELKYIKHNEKYMVVDKTRKISNVFVANTGDMDKDKVAVLKEVLNKLDGNINYKNKILQNISIIQSGNNGVKVSFEYATDAVKKILQKEGSILEVMIYFECKVRNIFDDIRMNVEFKWEDGITSNELDVVGVKNAKSYFISAKMSKPTNDYLQEIENISNRFGNEGQAVLVTSHNKTKHSEENQSEEDKHIRYRSKASGIVYISSSEIDKELEREEGGKRVKKRDIIIGDSINDIVKG